MHFLGKSFQNSTAPKKQVIKLKRKKLNGKYLAKLT